LARAKTAARRTWALAEAWADWALHLAAQPGKQLQLADKAARKSFRYAYHVISAAAGQR